MPKLEVKEIWIYPVKSLGGLRRRSARVLDKGFQYDRRWMLVDEDLNFMTQRTFPEMALLKLELHTDGQTEILFVRSNRDSIILPLDHHALPGTPIETKVWDDQVTVLEVSTIHSQWFSEQLNVKCKLVYFPEENLRQVDPRYSTGREQVSLADAYPFLIVGEPSLADLNKRLEHPVPMNRFRPNLVFSGGEPYEEDSWKNFTIGANRFLGVRPCGRCAITTVNQETAEKGFEPLTTLSQYRKSDGKVNFGQNVIAIDHGEIKEGDEIILG